MKLVQVAQGAVLADMLTPLSPQVAFALYGFTLPGTRTQLTGVLRYWENLGPSELAAILSTGLGLIGVGESRGPGWFPTAALGSQDGQRVVAKRQALGIPAGITSICDLEGMGGGAPDAIAYCNAWCHEVQPAGDLAWAYVGDSVPLSPMQLYQLPFTGYHRSLSNVQQVAAVDYSMYQAYPTMTLALPTGPLAVDLDFVTKDKRGRLPMMVVENGFGN